MCGVACLLGERNEKVIFWIILRTKSRTKRTGGNWIKNGLSTIATICDESYQLSKTIRFPWPNKLHGQRAIRFVVGDVMELDLIVRGWPYVVGGDLFVAVLSYLCICFRLLQYSRTNFITSISLWVIFNPTTAQRSSSSSHCPNITLVTAAQLRQYFRSNYVFDYLFINFFCMLGNKNNSSPTIRDTISPWQDTQHHPVDCYAIKRFFLEIKSNKT